MPPPATSGAILAARSERAPFRLFSPEDKHHLSELMCLTRAQIEVFAATPDDIAARARRGGGAKQCFGVGRVGIRCIHCASLPMEQRAKGAVSYPISIRVMNQAVRNWQRYHFDKCDKIPTDVKERYHKLHGKGDYSKKSSTEYWVKSCKRMGMIDTDAENGIHFGPEVSTGDEAYPTNSDGIAAYAEKGRKQNQGCHKSRGSKSVQARVDALSSEGVQEVLKAFQGEYPSPGDTPPLDLSFGNSELDSLEAEFLHDLAFSESDGTCGLSSGDASRRNSAVDASEVFHELNVRENISAPSMSSESAVSCAGHDCASNATKATMASLSREKQTSSIHKRSTLVNLVEVALGLAKSVKEDHDRGVPHFRSSVGNGKRFISDEQIRSDLVNLGNALYQLFAGADVMGSSVISTVAHVKQEETAHYPDVSQLSAVAEIFDDITRLGETTATLAGFSIGEDAFPTTKKQKGRRGGADNDVTMQDLGFPVSLCVVISSLMDANNDRAIDRYETAKEVEEDLRLMTLNPGRYLFDADLGSLAGRLIFPEGKLYGRDNHISTLMGVFDRMSRPYCYDREVVLVSGYSGTGKSVLVGQLCKPLHEKNGSFISGKFDELGQTQPMSVVFTAFDEFCGKILRGDKEKLVRMRQDIKDMLGTNVCALTGLMPNLAEVIAESTSTAVQVEGKNALNRTAYYFKLFLRAIARHSHPIVLFLDDLQWADEASIEIVSMLLSDAQMPSLLFVGSYRDNEVGSDHPLSAAMNNIALGGINVLSIKLDNIDRDDINALVSDTLHISPRLTRSLSDIVYSKTSGNPLFAVQFIRALYDEHLLVYSASSRRWEWEIGSIQAKDIADNVVDLMKKKISKLGRGTHRLLKMAACLGSQSETSTLQLLKSDGGSSVMPFLDIIVREGLMYRVGSYHKFSHDQIQQAAYSLISESEREAMHLRIGRLLWEKSAEESSDKIVFIIADQLIRGSALITKHDDKVKVARMCLIAGEKAMLSSSFGAASMCLFHGCSLLGESDWDDHYDLSLRLFTRCAEAQYVLGDYDEAIAKTGPVIAKGRSLQDMLRAQCTILNSLGAQGKLMDAIKCGLDFSAQLGETFPSDLNEMQTMADATKAQMISWNASFVDENSISQISGKDEMKDANKIAAMKILIQLCKLAYQVNAGLLASIVFRMVHLSLSHGVCRESSMAFAGFGALLCKSGEIEHGYQYGKLALSLLERFEAKEDMPRVYAPLYNSICIYVEPLQACRPPLRQAYEVGMSCGDIEWALVCVTDMFAVQWGSELGSLSEEVWAYVQQMKEYKHHAINMTLPYLQAILNLMGCTKDDPTLLTGDAMDQDELLSRSLESQNLNVELTVYFNRMWLAYIFQKYDLAEELAGMILSKRKNRPFRSQSIVDETFYIGLIAIVCSQKGSAFNWRGVAEDAVNKMKMWARNSSWNFKHKLELLNAELAHLSGDLDEAAKKYDDAIRLAGEHKFVHEQALACERAGLFYSEASSVDIATKYYERAHDYYLQWGAKRKASDLLELIEK